MEPILKVQYVMAEIAGDLQESTKPIDVHCTIHIIHKWQNLTSIKLLKYI